MTGDSSRDEYELLDDPRNVVRRRHGTRSAYSGGCRCDDCREANRKYVESKRRAAGVQPLKRGLTHGLYSTYNHGCRCADCREANRQRHLLRRRRLGAVAMPQRDGSRVRWPQIAADNAAAQA